MRDGRLLEDNLGRGKRRTQTPRTELACHASTLLALRAGDLICAPPPTPTMQLLLGADPLAIASSSSLAPTQPSPRWLPVEVGTDRLRLSAGAAMALKAQGNGCALLVYIRPGEASAAVWRAVLDLASKASLPILFVALGGNPDSKPPSLSLLSEKLGVPAIAVDAFDCIAIFRVAGEALLRARTGGGPVLIEAITAFPGAPRRRTSDPVSLLEQSLLQRHIVTRAWLRDTEVNFLKRLRPTSRNRSRLPAKTGEIS